MSLGGEVLRRNGRYFSSGNVELVARKETLLSPLVGLGVRHVYNVSDVADWPAGLDEFGPPTWGEVRLLPEPGTFGSLAAGVVLLGLLGRKRQSTLIAEG